MFNRFFEIKKWVIESVIWAEREFRGRTGAEKLQIVIEKVLQMIAAKALIPWWAMWAKEMIAPTLISRLANLAVNKLNYLTGWDFANVELTELQIIELACALDAPDDVMIEVCSNKRSVSVRIEELFQQYGITPEGITEANAPEILLPVNNNFDNQLSRNFTRREFACRDGCGFDIPTPEIVLSAQALRDYINRPVHVNSGCRCPARNAAVGGSQNSEHINGAAVDIHVSGLTNRQLGEALRSADRKGLTPHLAYAELVAGNTNTVVHMDTGRRRNNKWGW